MGYIASNKIAVFPCGRRSDQNDPAARLTTEFNLVSIINRLVDNDSFVVPFKRNDGDVNSTTSPSTELIFNIAGYLFKTTVGAVAEASGIGASDDTICAYIAVVNWPAGDSQMVKQYYQDLGAADNNATLPDTLDTNDGFIGVFFNKSSDQTPTGYTATLKLLTKSGSTYTIPSESLIKFKTGSGFHSVSIDDGDLDK